MEEKIEGVEPVADVEAPEPVETPEVPTEQE